MTLYNIFLSSGTTSFDHDWAIVAIDRILLDKIVEAYLRGIHKIKHNGKTYEITSYYFQVYEIFNELKYSAERLTEIYFGFKKSRFNGYWVEELFNETGKNVTADFLKGREWGELKLDLYNVYVNTDGNRFIKTTVVKDELEKFIIDWQHGETSGWLEGKQIIFRNPAAFVIYDISLKYRLENKGETKKYLNKQINSLYKGKWTTEALEEFGKDVTSEFNIGPYGSKQKVEVKTELKQPVRSKTGNKIFISHSSKDKLIVEKFVNEILILSLGVDHLKIFCSSIEGLGISSGEDFRQRIKKEINEAQMVIQIISKDYKSSEVCLNEMGAAWVLAETVIPLVLDGGFDVGFIHGTTHQLSLKKKTGILQFFDDWEHLFPNKSKRAKIEGHIEAFLKQANEKSS
jgi:hypothetical protein